MNSKECEMWLQMCCNYGPLVQLQPNGLFALAVVTFMKTASSLLQRAQFRLHAPMTADIAVCLLYSIEKMELVQRQAKSVTRRT